jgi:hypothetical protein
MKSGTMTLGIATLTTVGLFLANKVQRATACDYIRKDKKLRDHLSEKQIDKMIMDSFPASDPPCTY